jgi:uncharacterized membrane protein YfcA
VAIIAGSVAVFAGSTIQGVVGYGVSMLSAPILAIVAPRSMPAAIVLVALPMCVLGLWRERHHLDRGALPWLLLGVVPGTIVGLAIVAAVDDEHLLVLVIGIITVVGVAFSMTRIQITVTRGSAFTASVVGNLFGTAGGTSGAPLALLFQNERGPATRATVSMFFAASAFTSIIGYVPTGVLRVDQVEYAVTLLPAMLGGLLCSGPLRAYVDTRSFRRYVLAVTAVAGAAAIVRGVA